MLSPMSNCIIRYSPLVITPQYHHHYYHLLHSLHSHACWRSLMLIFNRQLIMEKRLICNQHPELRVLSDRIQRVLVSVYFYRGLSGNMEKRPTRRVYVEILTCHVIFYNLEDSRSHRNKAEAERGLAQGARPRDQGVHPPSVPNQSPLRRSCSTDLKEQG